MSRAKIGCVQMTAAIALVAGMATSCASYAGEATSAPSRQVAVAENPQQTEDAAFKDIYTEEWAWRKEIYWDPDSETMPAHLPDVSAAAQMERLKYWQDILGKLSAIDQAKLSPEAKISYDVYVDQISNLAASIHYKEYEMPLNSAGGFWTGLNYMTENNFLTEKDYRDYIALLSAFPAHFDAQITNMRSGLSRGFTQGRPAIEGRDAAIALVADVTDAEESNFYKPFREMPASIPAGVQAALRAEAKAAINGGVIPAYQSLLTFFREEYLPGARPGIAAYDLPDGKSYYDWKVREFTTYDQTPEEVHEIGLKDVDKIRGQMQEVMDEVGFKGSRQEFLTFLRTDPQFYSTSPEAYLKQAAWYSKAFDGVVSKYFGRLPRTRFGIKPFPPEIAPFATGGAGGRETYWLNTHKIESRPLYSLAALTLHESAPGHSFQMSLAAENTDLPEFRQEVYISAYGEGWALYCEKLGVEMGIYETPYDTFGMLSYQMWRAARLVVDTGLHAKGWSREQAVQYLLDNTAIGEHEVRTEIDRYITNPGQAVSYYTGQLAIEEARARAEEALGADFNIRAFHDVVLSLGSVPLPVLQSRIDRFIAEGGPSPFEGG